MGGNPVDGGPIVVPRHEHATNQVVIITLPAITRHAYTLLWVDVSYNGVPVGGRVTVKVGETMKLDQPIDVAGPTHVDLPEPICGESGQGMVITLAAGGPDISGKLNTGAQRRRCQVPTR